jgi:putative hemolysin
MKLIIFWLVCLVFIVLPVRASDIRLAMANPASAACTQAGGQLSTLQTAQGEKKLCNLPSGLVCDEWAFFKGTCGQEKPTQSKSSIEADKPVSAGSK